MLELLKPVTWFPPMWAFLCGIVSSGVSTEGHWPFILLGLLLAGPMVCGTSQAVNDWFDRHVDAINEPQRPIPSGRMPGHWGLYIAIWWTFVSLLLAAALGVWVFGAAAIGLALAWAYSAPPLRLKRNGFAVDHRRAGHDRRCAGSATACFGRALQFRCARHHDAQ
jgi:chlorophyll synthase